MSSSTMPAADAAWLHMDRPVNPMVVNSVIWFDAPLDWELVMGVISRRIVDQFPRFRRRVGDTLGRPPRFEDDSDFDIEQHLHGLALPAPGDQAALQELVSDLITPPLDPTRPLWHAYLIEGYGNGCAILFRIHHCIADGIALARVMLSLTDTDVDAGIAPSPRAAASESAFSLDSVTRPAGAAISAARRVTGAVIHEGLETLARRRLGPRGAQRHVQRRDDRRAGLLECVRRRQPRPCTCRRRSVRDRARARQRDLPPARAALQRVAAEQVHAGARLHGLRGAGEVRADRMDHRARRKDGGAAARTPVREGRGAAGRVGMPRSLDETGITRADFEQALPDLARAAFEDPSIRTNPRIPLVSELIELLEAGWRGW